MWENATKHVQENLSFADAAVYRCSDGYFRRVIFGLGPFIADYPEQVMLAGTKQGWCPRYVLYLFVPNYLY